MQGAGKAKKAELEKEAATEVASPYAAVANGKADVEGGIALDQTGFPDAMGERVYYAPTTRGMEGKLKEKLDALRAAREQARKPRGGA